MSRPQSGTRAFIEVTALAALMFLVPLGYYYGREHILNVQNKVYYKMFGIKEQHLDKYKKKQDEIRLQDQEKLQEIERKLKELEQEQNDKNSLAKPNTP